MAMLGIMKVGIMKIMKRLLKFLICFVVFIAIAAGVCSLLIWLVGDEYFQEGTMLRTAFKMVPLVVLGIAWQATADKEVDEVLGKDVLEKNRTYSPEDY